MSDLKKILIIESDVEIRSSFSAALAGAGYDVVVATDGKEAFFKVSNDRFDFIIVDICDPKIKSSELIDAFLLKNKNDKTYLIISSKAVSEDISKKIENLTFVHLFPKPILLRDLVQKIAGLIDEQLHGNAKPKKTSGFDVRVVNPLIAASLEAIAGVFESRLVVGKPYLRKDAEVSGDISGLIGLASDGFKGNVAISFSAASYLKVISKKFGVEVKELNDESRDAISEIIKLITDVAKAQFEKQSLNVTMTSPTVITGNDHSLNHQSKSAPVVILFKNDHSEGFRIEICTQS